MSVEPIAARQAAEERRDRIRAGLVTLWDDIKAAWRERDWLALGYESWDAMCDAEYRLGLVLPKDERPAIHAELRAEGMSTRAIAAATGVSHVTVQKDIAATGKELPDEIVSLDGRTRPATRVIEPEIVEAEVVEIPGEDYRDALERYPELNVEGAEAGDVVEIAAMIDARPEHEHRARADAGAKWLAAKAEGRLDTGPIVNETEAAERIYKSAYLLLKEADRYGDQLSDALLHADPLSRDIWERTLLRLAERAAELAEAIPTQTLRSIQ